MRSFDRSFGDQYHVISELGGGGMSRVYLATDTHLGREIVLKYLSPEICVGLSEERFRNETRVIAKLQHPYIVPLLTAGVADNCPFYTMPFVAGESLKERLEREGGLPVALAVSVMRDVAEALAYAHERGVVHRDIKPGNILLTGDHAVVTDFGVAKAVSEATAPGEGLTAVGTIVGTPAYMAPEQVSADPLVDHRADIYALGTVAYEMLAGRQVFSGDSPHRIMAAHVTQAVDPLARHRADVPPGLAAVVMKCLEKDPGRRFQSAREIVAALDAIRGVSGSAHALLGASLKRNKLAWGAAAVAVILLAVAAILLQPSAASARQSRLLVLPFDNLGEAADQYFAEGLAEEITNRLTQLDGVEVIGRGSGAQLKRAGKTAQQIGQELNADYVLDGSVRWARTGNDSSLVRVTPALIRTSTGVQVWGEPYQGVLAQVFALQSAVAEQVATALKLKLEPRDFAALRIASTTDLSAFDAYLLGRHYWKQRTPESLARAIQEFEKAIARDPNFARAHAGLGDAYAVLPSYSDSALPQEFYARAERASRRALQLDPGLAEAHAGLGQALYYQQDWIGSYRALTRALQLDPGYATAHQWMGELLMAIGRGDAAESSRRATLLEPAMPVMLWTHGYALLTANRLAEGEAALLRAHELAPHARIPNLQLAFLYTVSERPKQAIPFYERIGTPAAVASALSHMATAADSAIVARAAARQPVNFVAAVMSARAGARDSAFAALNRSIDRKEALSVLVKVDPMLGPFRKDPRYQGLLRKAGLTDEQLRQAGLLR